MRLTRRQLLRSAAGASLYAGLPRPLRSGIEFIGGQGFDILIRNAAVLDGTGKESFIADVGVRGERIAAVGKLGAEGAERVIDAAGRTLSPGFIDIHTHTDLQLLRNPKAESKIRQGVTTELSGNCGDSVFPRLPEESAEEEELKRELGLDRFWTDLEGYHSLLQARGLALNHATLVGNASVRGAVMGFESREPAAAELERMKTLVAQAMEQGAFGLSTGLEYTPSGFASSGEIIELCRVAAAFGGFYATHVRSEDEGLMEAVAEALHIALSAGLPLQISHLKASGRRNYYKMPMVLDLIERAGERGLDVTADRYPYTAYATGLSIMYPKWAREGGSERFVARLTDWEMRAVMKEETLARARANNSWESLMINDVEEDKNRGLVGKFIHEAAAERGLDVFEFCCELLISEGGDVGIVGFGMSEENTERVISHPLVMIASDGTALAPYGKLGEGLPHPRSYGTYPRFLGFYVRERKLLSLPEAVRKITSMPAAKMGLRDRGVIGVGNYADLVVFDPEAIIDKATYVESELYPVGIDYVLVNGKVVIDLGEHSGELPGKALAGPGKR